MAVAVLVFQTPSATAEVTATQPQFSWREMWAGADATKDVWLLYTGITLAPLSKDVYTDGLRLRLTSGYGQYKTTGTPQAPVCIIKNGQTNSCTGASAESFKVNVNYVDLLAGYHMQLGKLTAKAFLGASMIDHEAGASGISGNRFGREFGATGALEFWLNINELSWSSLNLSYTTAHNTGAASWRAGWRVLPTLSIGPEVRFDYYEKDGTGRVGAFARYEWFGGEISAAAGVAKSFCDSTGSSSGHASCEDFAPYATLNYLTQF